MPLILGLLGIAAVIKGMVPRWRAKWGWGRGGSVPISIVGHCGVGLSFLLIAAGSAGLASRWNPVLDPVLVISGFLLFIAAGLYDSLNRGRPRP